MLGGPEGVANLFLAHCALGCAFCQNSQISQNPGKDLISTLEKPEDLLGLLDIFFAENPDLKALGLVTAGHYVPLLWEPLQVFRTHHPQVRIIYNSGGYERPDVLATLENLVDVYLPDFKFSLPDLSNTLCQASDYPKRALTALREMVRQKGCRLRLDEEGRATTGVLVRHLVLPGHMDNSLQTLEILHDTFGPGLPLSLMSQYHPGVTLPQTELNRPLFPEEYQTVLKRAQELGFLTLLAQALDSVHTCLPDFAAEDVFAERSRS